MPRTWRHPRRQDAAGIATPPGNQRLLTLGSPFVRFPDDRTIWLYFLLNAEKMDPEALPEVLSTPLYQRAVKELTMLSQTDIERERYEARRKGQLDHISSLKAARIEAEAEGEIRGEARGAVKLIRFCERLIGRSAIPDEQLQALSPEELARLANDLQEQVSQLRLAPGA